MNAHLIVLVATASAILAMAATSVSAASWQKPKVYRVPVQAKPGSANSSTSQFERTRAAQDRDRRAKLLLAGAGVGAATGAAWGAHIPHNNQFSVDHTAIAAALHEADKNEGQPTRHDLALGAGGGFAAGGSGSEADCDTRKDSPSFTGRNCSARAVVTRAVPRPGDCSRIPANRAADGQLFAYPTTRCLEVMREGKLQQRDIDLILHASPSGQQYFQLKR